MGYGQENQGKEDATGTEASEHAAGNKKIPPPNKWEAGFSYRSERCAGFLVGHSGSQKLAGRTILAFQEIFKAAFADAIGIAQFLGFQVARINGGHNIFF